MSLVLPQEKAGLSGNDCPFQLEGCRDLQALARALGAAGYTQSALAETTRMANSADPLDVCLIARRTAAPTPYNTLVRLFLIGESVPVEMAGSALAPVGLDQLTALGLLQRTDTGVRSRARLTPVGDLVLGHDFDSEVTGQPLLSDFVLGPGAASITLANLTVRRQVESVLDLGTGCGIQALLASQHAVQVIATDINRRALNFAQFNVKLNGTSNVELREGSLYEPVRDCQFDLIVANPPFVVSPESRYAFRDSGWPGDTISENVIRGAPRLLREGGYCISLCNWHHRHEGEWIDRPRQWMAATGCDAWLLRIRTLDPLSYASNWLRPTEGRDPDHYGRLLDEWVEYHQRMGIGFISAGAVILQRRSGGPNWFRADTASPGPRLGSCGEQIERIFAAQALLQELGEDEPLLDRFFRLVPEHELEHTLQARDGGWTLTSARLKLNQGFEFMGDADPALSSMLARCDGRHVLRELVADLARSLGMQYEALAPSCVRVVRKLMLSGFLTTSASQHPDHEGRSRSGIEEFSGMPIDRPAQA